MTSERQRAANRLNAQKSTGPRGEAGKRASRRNALRHGLATAVSAELGADVEIAQLADAIVEEAARWDLRPYAVRIAEAEIDLRRIRHARKRWLVAPPVRYRTKQVDSENAKLFSKAVRKLLRRKELTFEMLTPAALAMGWTPFLPLRVDRNIGKPLGDRTEKILDRYEKRALSRRKFAIRDFDAARLATRPGKT